MRIWNTGVAGWGPNQYRIQVQQILDTSAVDGFLVFVYLGNDIEKTVVESYAPKKVAERHSLRWPRSLDKKELVNALAYPVNDFLEERSHLFILMRTRLKILLMRLGLSAYYFPEVLLVNQASSTEWSTTADILADLAGRAAARRLQTVFVLIPSQEEADPTVARDTARGFGIPSTAYDVDQARLLLGREMQRRQLVVVDTTTALRQAIARGEPDVYGHIDEHLGKTGHKVVEKEIEDTVWTTFFDPPVRAPAP